MAKGITICVSVAIIILIVIGVMAIFYWFAFARFFELHVLVEENEVQRRTINMANILLSYEDLIPSSSETQTFFCTGEAKACNEFNDKRRCENQLGCNWCGCGEFRDSAGPINCFPDISKEDCHGCVPTREGIEHCKQWVGCRGTATPCSLRDESTCGNIATTGCNLISITRISKKMRGVFDSTKLGLMARSLKKADTKAYADAFLTAVRNAKELNIGYPNTYTTFAVVDLESCENEKCDGWVGAFKGPFSIDATYAGRFIDCLGSHIDVNIGSIFRGIACYAFTPALTSVCALWQPWDLAKCGKEAMSGLTEIFFGYSSLPTISSGYPVLIQYPDGSLHIGRLHVGVWQWA